MILFRTVYGLYNQQKSKMGARATWRQQMQHELVLAEHTDHLLRFSFIASVHVERPCAGNDQKKMRLVLCYRAPQSVCFP